ncbi:MAG: endonuclease/exonuclease/phosphatase family protein [Terrimicrobiaceae bacterium]
MFATLGSFWHRLRRRLSRDEWAIRHLALSASVGTSEEPGLLLIQIDGLPLRQVEAAMAAGRMPFLRRLREHGQYPLHTFYSGLPSTTPAVQGELYYGVRAGVPAFSFLDRSLGEIGMLFDPDWARRFEEKFAAQGEGLLKGGSSWSNIFSGGATPEESNFCVAHVGFGDSWRAGRVFEILFFLLLQLPALLRISCLVLFELVIGLPEAARGIFKGQWFSQELGMVLSRMCVGIALREIVTIGGKVDVTRGLPVVHLNFLGYDELAHRRGPRSRFAHWSLRGIDRAIKALYLSAHRSQRRDYHVWIFSDHGQEEVQSFAMKLPEGIKTVVAECVEMMLATHAAWRVRANGHPLPQLFRKPGAKRRHLKERLMDAFSVERGKSFSITATGPLGHLYFAEPIDDAQKSSLARRLVERGKLPGVLHRAADGKITWYHARGETAVPGELPGLLQTHPETLRAELAQDVARLCENENSGDLVLLGWNWDGSSWSFAPERGAHAGPGPDETQGFLLVSPATKLPPGATNFVRPDGLRDAALALLGRKKLPAPEMPAAYPSRLRVMSYNVHSCIGMDGRVSPRRIARVIAEQSPDLVALQELDHGRLRSRGENQAAAIAQILGYQVTFLATVTRGAERYGHAVLSRWPIRTVKVAELPTRSFSIWPEPRGALWSRVFLGNMPINIVTTHLGLSASERLTQMQTLLGPQWLGPILDTQAIVLCGDFNLPPGTAPYRLAADRLRDVASNGSEALNTFISTRPFARIDHIFVSSHFSTESVSVVRNYLTRVSSDHLPLLADLHVGSQARKDEVEA